jgi:hypothetical protein
MRIKFAVPVLTAGIFLICSCATSAVWDQSLPPEQTATLSFSGVSIKAYNGVPVHWDPAAFGGLEIKIPAGENEFLVDVNTGVFVARDVLFRQTFQGGKKYTLYAGYNRSIGTTGMTIVEDGLNEGRFAPFKKL